MVGCGVFQAHVAITGGPNSAKDGVPGTAEDRRIDHIIPRKAVLAGAYQCYIEVSVNALFGLGLNGFRHQQPDVSGLSPLRLFRDPCVRPLPLQQMNVSFQLAIADIVLVRSEARALFIDFKLLVQMAKIGEHQSLGISQKALHVCNEIMNHFHRSKGDEEGKLDQVVKKCRELAASLLGDPNVNALVESPNAQIWGIGHW